MHRADLHIEGLRELPTWPLTAERVTDLLTLAQKRNVRDANYMLERIEDILVVVERQHAAHAVLSRNKTVSHGDLDHKNVLWSEDGEPLLIDWESARPINSTYEVLVEALDWSGITAHFDLKPFENFLSVYARVGGVIDEGSIPAAFDAIFGAWVNWMLYNVGRSAGVEDLRQRAIGSEQIDLAVSALLRLEKNIPRLQDIAQRYATGGLGEVGGV
jgi:Ser/Thr protein kinase RdoA (MazF antagonist)